MASNDPTEAAVYHDFITDPRFSMFMTLGGVEFHINPDTIQIDSERIFTDLPTRAGFIRFSYGVRPRIYSIDGTTGNAGVKAIRAMDRFTPWNRPSGGQDSPIKLAIPAMFGPRVTVDVFVNKFSESMRGSDHLYNYYSLELEEYPKPEPVIEKSLSIPTDGILNLIQTGAVFPVF